MRRRLGSRLCQGRFDTRRDGRLHRDFHPARGDYEYKVAEGGSWDASYGQGGAAGGANIAYSLKEETAVTFYYNHATHRVWNNVSDQMVTLPGSFQKDLGCADNWKPECPGPALGAHGQRHLHLRDDGIA